MNRRSWLAINACLASDLGLGFLSSAGILRPMLCITGSDDGDVVNNGATQAQRAAVFDALPRGQKAGLASRMLTTSPLQARNCRRFWVGAKGLRL